MSKLSIPEELKKRYDIPQRDLILYSITGIFGSFQEKGCAAFGGYFRYDVESRILFDGQLIDRWGASVIHGEMNDEILEFEKMYHHDKNRFNYKFRKENGIWRGTYQFKGRGTSRGMSQCITQDVADAWNINCGAPFRGEKPDSVEGLKELDLSCYRLPGVDLP